MKTLNPVQSSSLNDIQKNKSKDAAVTFLRTIFLERQLKNPLYTLKAFARDLGMSRSHLSRIFSKTRPLSFKQAVQVSLILGLNQAKADSFLHSVVEDASETSKISKKLRSHILSKGSVTPLIRAELGIEEFQTISEWYHLAILNLTYVKGFKSEVKWIAKRLGISVLKVQDACDRLFSMGLLKQVGTRWVKSENHINFNFDRSHRAIREHYLQMNQKASDCLQDGSEAAYAKRFINGMTIALNPAQLPEFKKMILDFQDQIASRAASPMYEEVYQLNVQLFPLTQPQTKTESTENENS